MARRGVLGRLVDAIERFFTPEPPTPPKPPPEPPEPPETPGGGGGGGGTPDDDFRDAWREQTNTNADTHVNEHIGSFQRHYDLFDMLPGMQEIDHDEQLELWELYLRVMVMGDAMRNDPNNGWWSAIGIHPRSAAFDWDEFRNAMGYKRRR